MSTKYTYEFGKRWLAKTPRRDIRYLVGQYHVATPFAEIESRLAGMMPDSKGFTPAIRRQTVDYARLVHAENMKLYRRVYW